MTAVIDTTANFETVELEFKPGVETLTSSIGEGDFWVKTVVDDAKLRLLRWLIAGEVDLPYVHDFDPHMTLQRKGAGQCTTAIPEGSLTVDHLHLWLGSQLIRVQLKAQKKKKGCEE